MNKLLPIIQYSCILLLGITLSFFKSSAQFSASGTQAGTVTTASTTQGTDWNSPLNVQSGDNVFATCLITGSNKPTYYLDAKNWGFQSGDNTLPTYIPSNAAINGIEVFIKLRKTNIGNMKDNKIILLKAGSEAGSSKARGSTIWPTASTEIKFGGNIDLWGTTWTAADLTNTGFGIRISAKNRGSKDAQAEIDYVRINLYFNQDYYYSKSTGNLELTTSWGINSDGSGTNPVNFSNNGQVFFLKNRTTATLTNNFSITGTYSKLVVGDGVSATTLTIPSYYSFTGIVDVANLSNLTISNTTGPTIGALSDNTTVTYNAAGNQTIMEATYYNLSLSGAGTKTANSTTGSMTINNALTIASGITVDNQGNNILIYGVSTAISNSGTATGTGRYIYALLDVSTNITGTGSYSNLEIDFSTTAATRTLTLSNATSITGTLYLTDGTFANGSNLTMSNGSTIELADGVLGSSITSSDYSVTYDPYTTASPKSTANELTGSLKNLSLQTGSGLAINLNRNLILSGNLVLITGTLDPTAGNYNISIAGNYSNNASLTYRNNLTTFNGSASQTLNAPSAQTFYDLAVNNTSGGLQINTPVTANHALTLTSGIVTTGSTNILTVADGAAISGGNSSSYINGPIKHLLAATTGTKFFPVGKSGVYRPVSLSLTQVSSSSTSYTGEVFQGAPPSRTLPGTLSQVSSVRYYTVSSSNNANLSSAIITLNYGLDDNITDPANLRIAKSSGSNWLNLGGTGSGSGSGTITSNSFTSFSDFVLATNNILLPLKWISFTVTMKNNVAELKWETAEETNTGHFNVEKSADGLTWRSIGIVYSNNGMLNTYLFNDNQPLPQNFYRIQSIDRDGKKNYSKVISLTSSSTGTISLLSNPVKAGAIELSVTGNEWLQKEKLDIQVFDLAGHLIISEQRKPESILQINIDKMFPGCYFLKVQANDITKQLQFVVQ
jgi:trimeric autotransporter adhesin